MKTKTGKTLQYLRIIAQILFLSLFLFLFFHIGYSEQLPDKFVGGFFYFDPYLLIINFLSTGKIIFLFLLALIPLVLTLVLGRFFCGWVCPFGAINQFFTWIFRKSKYIKSNPGKRSLRLKYLILIAVVISTLAGFNLGGWVDPFSLFTRSLTTIVPAGDYLVSRPLELANSDMNLVSKSIKPIEGFAKKNVLMETERVSAQPVIIGGIFIFLLCLNYYKKRFFCNVFCPLGAIFGLLSRISFLRFTSSSSCNSCGVCSRNCTFSGNPGEHYLKSECMVCFNCVVDCANGGVDVQLSPVPTKDSNHVDLGKRSMIGAVGAGLVLAAIPNTGISARSTNRRKFMRPPGAVKEKLFLNQCISCGQCIQSCPTGFIQPALLESGLEGLWTPVVNARAGVCTFDCNRCTGVCPTGAIQKLTLKQKQEFKIGVAVIDKNLCYTYADGFNCTACQERCPTPEKAIQFRATEVWNFQGKRALVRQIYVVPDLCIGCGICENVCPRRDSPGIYITAEDETREMEGSMY